MRYVESLRGALDRCMKADERVYVIGEDVVDPYGGAFKVTRGLSSAYPGRVIATPISEAGLTGVGIGLALRGMRPVVEIMFGDFITLAADQIVNHAAKFRWMYDDQVRVPLVVRAPMGGYRGYGPTHSQSLEAMFLGVPGLSVVSPSLYADPGALLERAVLHQDDPVLFIEHKVLYARKIRQDGSMPYSRVVDPSAPWPTMALSMVPDEPPDLTLIAYGYAATLAVEAAVDVFMEEEILVEVLVPSCLKPLPAADLVESVRRSGKALVVEEGPVTGGWGAEVSAFLHEALHRQLVSPVRRLGARELPIPSAKTMEEQVLPQAEDIGRAIRALAGR